MTDAGRPRILLLAMYPLDRGLWGATTRITQLRDALAVRARLDVASGTRGARAVALARYAVGGRLKGLDGIYVESSTALPGPADLGFLALARARRVPVLTYVRDAQQLFTEYYRADSPRRRLSRAAFRPAIRSLMAVSSRVTFPSRGLARAVLGNERAAGATLLPPGARLGPLVPIDPAARGLLFVGSLRYPAHGGELLLDALHVARDAGVDPELLWVAPPDETPRPDLPSWVRLERAQGAELDALLPAVRATITPRRRTPYNDLAVPIKVLEYLGFARPLLVTDTIETRAIVEAAGCGLVVPDTPQALGAGIVELLQAPLERIEAWGAAARAHAEANSWGHRADRVLQLLAEERR